MFNEFNGEAIIINVIIKVKIITFKTFLSTIFSFIIFKHILTYILLYRIAGRGNLSFIYFIA